MIGTTQIENAPMSHRPRTWILRWRWLAGIAVLLIILAACIPACQTFVLMKLGHLLVADQPSMQPADIIVVAIDAKGAGTLTAADLVHRGVSNRVAVFNDPPSPEDQEFLRRGLPYEDRAAISLNQLRSLGVTDLQQIPRSTSGSEQEGEILPGWCEKMGYHSVFVVTSSDHSRRLSRILHRASRAKHLSINIQSSRYSQFDPDTWWKSRVGQRNGIVELQKLLLDVLRHPFS